MDVSRNYGFFLGLNLNIKFARNGLTNVTCLNVLLNRVQPLLGVRVCPRLGAVSIFRAASQSLQSRRHQGASYGKTGSDPNGGSIRGVGSCQVGYASVARGKLQ